MSHSSISKGCDDFHFLVDEVMLLHVFPHLYLQASCLRMLGVHADVCILYRAIHVVFKILGTSVSFLALLVPRSLFEVEILPNLFIPVHILGQRVRFMPKLFRTHRFAIKSKTLLKFRDIPVGCGILDVFLEVSL